MKINREKKFTEFFDVSRDTRQIDFLVLHHVEANSINHAIEQFREHKVSAHFVIDEQGNIFELVDENDVAYHAGVSFWNGCEGLNKSSIGIEFINLSPFFKKFEERQMIAGVELCKYIAAKYNIKGQNIVGHSDIAYNKTTGLANRKQDPSHLFDWKFLSDNGIGIFPQIVAQDKKVFEIGNKDAAILTIKENLQKFGYRVINLNDDFDQEMQALALVFNRRFLGKDLDIWMDLSQKVLFNLKNYF